jgi:hypothetical protein
MKTITIESEYESMFNLYALELITACGVVQCHCVYVNRSRAEEMADYYYRNGWRNMDNERYKVYQVNIFGLDALV